MMNLKEKLLAENCTCVLADHKNILMLSYEKGVMPLYQYIKTHGKSVQPLYLADKIVGSAAALLAVYLGVKDVYTPIISEGAIAIFTHQHITFKYETIVPYINNRSKDGQCPMETAVQSVLDCEKGYAIIDNFIQKRKMGRPQNDL